MPLTSKDLLDGASDAVQSDPEVREARMIAEAAHSRLLECVATPHEVVDLARAQRLLDALRDARVIAGDAEDRVLVHRGLLTVAEAERRAAARRPDPRGEPSAAGRAVGGARVIQFRPGRRPALPVIEPPVAARALTHVLLPVAAGLAGAVLARRLQRR